jgi:hypothetical protein
MNTKVKQDQISHETQITNGPQILKEQQISK